MSHLISHRHAMLSSPALPRGCVAVEYLQSSGIQWIDTGITPTQATFFRVKMYLPSATSTLGKHGLNSTGGSNGRCAIGANKTILYFGMANTNTDISVANTVGLWWDCSIDMPTGVISYNGATRKVSHNRLSTSHKLRLFQAMSEPIACRLALAQIAAGGVPLRDYIPVRRDGVGYLYDAVSRTLFGNAGSGAFTVGPDR